MADLPASGANQSAHILDDSNNGKGELAAKGDRFAEHQRGPDLAGWSRSRLLDLLGSIWPLSKAHPQSPEGNRSPGSQGSPIHIPPPRIARFAPPCFIGPRQIEGILPLFLERDRWTSPSNSNPPESARSLSENLPPDHVRCVTTSGCSDRGYLASNSPTFFPAHAKEIARLVATALLPTPPLPERTRILCRIFFMRHKRSFSPEDSSALVSSSPACGGDSNALRFSNCGFHPRPIPSLSQIFRYYRVLPGISHLILLSKRTPLPERFCPLNTPPGSGASSGPR